MIKPQPPFLTGDIFKTTILYSIDSHSFAPSINVTINPAPKFLSILPGDIKKIYNKIIFKSEGGAFFLK